MLSIDDVLRTRFASTRLRPGYDRVDVSTLLDRVVDALETGGDVDVDAARLRQTRWREGYDMAEVDAFLDEVRVTLASPRTAEVLDDESATPVPWHEMVRHVLGTVLVGEPYDGEPRPVTPPRAVRASARHVTVARDGLTWRSRWLRPGRLAVADIAQVLTVRLEYNGTTSSVADFAFVLDHAGSVRLRVRLRRSTPQDLWEPLGVPVTRDRSTLGRPKDVRRRWPEAISWAHAYPIVATVLIAAASLLVVSVLDQLA
jgi:DivIVA domain-containing protein